MISDSIKRLNNIYIIKPSVGAKSYGMFCRRLSFLCSSGIELPRAFQILSRQNKDRFLAGMTTKVQSKLMQGESLHRAVRDAGFPAFFTGMCRIGEQTGKMDEAMKMAADYFDNAQRTRSDIANALIYPAAVFAAMVSVIIMTVVYVLPVYATVFTDISAELPPITQALLDFAGFMSDNGILLSMLSILVAAGIVMFLRSERGRYLLGYAMLNMPAIGKLGRINASLEFARAMAVMTAAGMQISEAAIVTRDVLGNFYMKQHVELLTTGLAKGESLSEVMLVTGLFDEILLQMIRVGEETGMVSQAFKNGADYLDAEIKSAVTVFGKLIEPVLTVVLGLVMGFLMLSVMLPTFNLINAV